MIKKTVFFVWAGMIALSALGTDVQPAENSLRSLRSATIF